MLIGYMRVSTDGDRKVLDLQRDALLSAASMSATCSRNRPAATAPASPRPSLKSGTAIA